MIDVTDLWTAIGEFDAKEVKAWHSDDNRWEARASARMQAYVELFDRTLDDKLENQ